MTAASRSRTGFADPTFTPPGDFDQADTYTNSGSVQNLNHGKQSTAVYNYGSDAAIAALGYICVQDTGMNAGDSSLLWRGLANADGGGVACKPGTDGVKVWYAIDGGLAMITDKGDFSPGWTPVTFGTGGPGVYGTSNLAGSPDGNCVGGINPSISTTVAAAIAAGVQAVTPSSMAFIAAGRTLTIDPGGSMQEVVTVTATSATTFTATFCAGPCRRDRRAGRDSAVRATRPGCGGDRTRPRPRVHEAWATSRSVPLTQTSSVSRPRTERLFLSSNALAADPSFNQATNGQPGGNINAITIDPAGNVYVLLSNSVTSGPSEFPTTGPLFLVTSSGWTQCNCTGLPTDGPGGAS